MRSPSARWTSLVKGRQGALLSLGLAFNVSTALFALPLYLHLYASPGTIELVRLMLVVQVVPTLAIFVVDRFLVRRAPSPRWPRLYRASLAFLALASLARLAVEELLLGPLHELAFRALISFIWLMVDLGLSPEGIGVLLWLLPVSLLATLALLLLIGRAGRRLVRLFASVTPVFLVLSAFFLLYTAVFGGAVGPTQAAPAHAAGPPRSDSVFILIFDELGQDVLLADGQLDGGRFPHLKDLAAESAWFTNATTNYFKTCQAVPSLLTGRALVLDGVHPDEACRDFRMTQGETNVLARLSQDYRLSIYQEYLRGCRSFSPHTCRGIPYLTANYPHLAVGRYLVPDMARRAMRADWLDRSFSPYTSVLFDEFLADIDRDTSRGRVHLVHLLLPHSPYVYDAQGRLHHSPYEYFTGEPEHDRLTYPNYEQQAILVDSLVGQFVERLKAEGLYEEATIVITSDHGPGSEIHRSESSTLEGIDRQRPNVPLLIRGPRVEPVVLDVDYQHVDFPLTVLDALGLEPMPGTEGVSAFSPEPHARQKWFTRWVDGQKQTLLFEPELDRWLAEPGVSE